MILSPIQLLILEKEARGIRRKEIARQLKLTKTVIEVQMFRARAANDCDTEIQLVVQAYRAGLLNIN